MAKCSQLIPLPFKGLTGFTKQSGQSCFCTYFLSFKLLLGDVQPGLSSVALQLRLLL